MKKILFALLIFAFVGCESGIGTGDLYLVPPIVEEEYIDGIGFVNKGVSHYGVDYIVYSGSTEVKSGSFKNPIYVELPTGYYTVHLESVFKNYWNDPTYSDDIEIKIRRNQTTRLDILPF